MGYHFFVRELQTNFLYGTSCALSFSITNQTCCDGTPTSTCFARALESAGALDSPGILLSG